MTDPADGTRRVWEVKLPEGRIELPSRVHHFTSLPTLAAILRQRTLRLNRLDQVEDGADGLTNLAGSQAMTYASCWTTAADGFPHWKLYGGHGRGVRISFNPEKQPFAGRVQGRAWPRPQRFRLSPAGLEVKVGPRAAFRYLDPSRETVDPGVLWPQVADLQRVMYVDRRDGGDSLHDVLVTPYVDRSTGAPAGATYDAMAIGLVKDAAFRFEEEWRYVATCTAPSDDLYARPVGHPDAPPHFDLPLRLDFFEDASLEIQVGPLATDDDEEIVRCLLARHAPVMHPENLTRSRLALRAR